MSSTQKIHTTVILSPDRGRGRRISIITMILLLASIPLFAGAFSATIITRTGIVTAPLKVPFDTASVLGGVCVNHNLKVTITAANSQRTAARFEQVQLYGKDGVVMGNNVASKTDALSATPYSFSFTNFGVPGALLDKVAGVQVAFIDSGGDDSSGKITVSAVLVSDDCQSGTSCVIIPDQIIQTKEKPPVSIESIQKKPRLVVTTVSGGGGAAATAGPQGGGTFANSGSGNDWTTINNTGTDDGLYAEGTVEGGIPTPTFTKYLMATNFGFSIPSTATINGLEATVHRTAAGSQIYVKDRSVKFVKAGTVIGNELAAGNWSQNSDEYKIYGGSTNLVGTSWTASDINNSGFGFAISADPTDYFFIAKIDYISIKIYYTTASASVYDSFKEIVHSMRNELFCFLLRGRGACIIK